MLERADPHTMPKATRSASTAQGYMCSHLQCSERPKEQSNYIELANVPDQSLAVDLVSLPKHNQPIRNNVRDPKV